MITHRSAIHQKLLTGFLATVLVIAGIIAGMRFAGSENASTVESDAAIDNSADIDINIEGEWVGTTTEDYGDEALYDYRVVFEQDGDDLTGTLYLTRSHEVAIYTETRFEGWVRGDTVFYSSQEIMVIENASHEQLCLVDTTVEYQVIDGQETMIGTWEGQSDQQPGCDVISGRVVLIRQPE